jgi:hypothetical protein
MLTAKIFATDCLTYPDSRDDVGELGDIVRSLLGALLQCILDILYRVEVGRYLHQIRRWATSDWAWISEGVQRPRPETVSTPMRARPWACGLRYNSPC